MYTIDDIMSWRPCPRYTRADIKKLFRGKDCINEFDVVDMPIPYANKGWALGHMLPWDDKFILPKQVTDLWVEGNSALTELHVPAGVTTLQVVCNAALAELHVPAGVTTLWVVDNAALAELHIPDGVTTLWVVDNAALAELHIPDGVTDLRVYNNPKLEKEGKYYDSNA